MEFDINSIFSKLTSIFYKYWISLFNKRHFLFWVKTTIILPSNENFKSIGFSLSYNSLYYYNTYLSKLNSLILPY